MKRNLENEKKFIERSIKIFGDKFDRSEVYYVNCRTAVILTCKPCNRRFGVKPNQHLRAKYGCKTCHDNSMRSSNEEFTEKSKNKYGEDTFNYSKLNYINNDTKVILICNRCGTEDEHFPDSHLRDSTILGCRKCFDIKGTMTTEQFIEKAIKKIDLTILKLNMLQVIKM